MHSAASKKNSINSSPMLFGHGAFSPAFCTHIKLWHQAIFICAQSLRLPSSKFKMPILGTQSLRLPSRLRGQYRALNHCACRPPYFALNHCVCSPPSLRDHYFALNPCVCSPPSSKDRKRQTGPKKKIWEDDF